MDAFLGVSVMATYMAVHFNCANCDALYQKVKAEAGPESTDCELTCRVCGGPLPAGDGQFVFKYFLLREAIRSQKWQRQRARDKRD